MSQVTLTGENPRQTPQASLNASVDSGLHSLALTGDETAPFWLVVPTYNPGLQDWSQWLQALQGQHRQPARVVVVDSGSTDGSLALTEQAVQAAYLTKTAHTSETSSQGPAFTLLHVKAAKFDHGGTRQWALNQALQAHPHSPPRSWCS